MMAEFSGPIKASELAKENGGKFVVEVEYVIDWRFRLGLWLMKLGARLMGCDFATREKAG
jgi:hypothetical protein